MPDRPTGTPPAEADAAPALPLRLWLRFDDPQVEQRFVASYVAFYFRFAQVSLLLGLLLVIGDQLADRVAFAHVHDGGWRWLLSVPVLLAGLGYSALPHARRHWQPVMAAFIVTVALSLFHALARIDDAGGAGLGSWVGVLNFTFLQFYAFVILGVQFRYALPAGLLILAAFAYAMWTRGVPASGPLAYWSYHVVTLFMLAAGIGWWREFLLRKEFATRDALVLSRAAAEQLADRLAHYDDVTGLPNRRLFHELAQPALRRARRHGGGCVVMHADIDRFTGVNDAYGRSRGDAVLAQVAQRLRRCVRSSDLATLAPSSPAAGVVARLDDSAYTILVADVASQEQATLVAQRLLAAVAEPITLDDLPDAQPLVLSASLGIAMFPADGDDLGALTDCAEWAARVAKEAGRGQHRFFDEALNAQAREQLRLEAELRQAIDAGQLRLHYQPKVDARDGALLGAEALVRWQHPERGLLLPQHFIPLAEDSGLIAPLTDWVLQAACRDLRGWADAGLRLLPVSVNLPASCLVDLRLHERLDTLTQRHALQPSLLTLEVTETTLMQQLDTAGVLLEQLRARGYGLSLDDFGTGYSSLSYLKRLPISELKIDRAFVSDIGLSGRDGALAAAIVALGTELDLQVVAEGVESGEQAAFLLARGCVVQQGYLYARPVPPPAYAHLLVAGRLTQDDPAEQLPVA